MTTLDITASNVIARLEIEAKAYADKVGGDKIVELNRLAGLLRGELRKVIAAHTHTGYAIEWKGMTIHAELLHYNRDGSDWGFNIGGQAIDSLLTTSQMNELSELADAALSTDRKEQDDDAKISAWQSTQPSCDIPVFARLLGA